MKAAKRSWFSIIVLLLMFILSGTLMSRSIVLRTPKDYTLRSGQWKYSVQFTNPGTRSEGTHGRLYYKNRSVVSRFNEIWMPLGQLVFYEGRYMWGNHGWIRHDRKNVISLPRDERTISKSAKKRGWYQGKLRHRKTPQSWVRVKRNNTYWWVTPEKLGKLAQLKKWSVLHPDRFHFQLRK